MTDQEKNIVRQAMPIYSLTNIEKLPNNPYREFAHYAAYTVYNKLPNHTNLSLKDFNELPHTERLNIIRLANAYGDVNINFKKSDHEKVFLEFDYMAGSTVLCNVKFYLHKKFFDESIESCACEIDFSENDIFDFLNISKSDNFFDFAKTDECNMTIDVILACLYIFANPTEFIKVYKAKSIVTKNITMFTKKLIEPIVTDMSIIFTPEYFLIGVICGTSIIKEKYAYDNYLESIKSFVSSIKEKFGDTYVKQDETDSN